MIFHLGGLETDTLTEGMKMSVSMEEVDPRKAPHEPLKPPVAGGRSFAKGTAGRTLSKEKKRVWEGRERSGV
jgi:hypothetical protein